MRGAINAALACFWLLAGAVPAGAQPTAAQLATVFPGATRVAAAEGAPPVQQVWRGDAAAGFVFSSRHVAAATGAAPRPLDLLIGLGLDCRITGVELLAHREPILLIGLPDSALVEFVRGYVGLDIARPVRLGVAVPAGGQSVQTISRATVSSYALHDAVLGTARLVARSRRLACMDRAGAAGGARLDLDSFAPETWDSLRADGSIATLAVTAGEAASALRRAGAAAPAAAALPEGANYATLFAALATPRQIGANLLGQTWHARLAGDAGPGASLLFLGGSGFYSFRGRAYLRSGVLDRIQLVQGERSFTLTAAQQQRLERIPIAGAPDLREISVFVLAPDSGFRPDRPWRIDLAVTEPDGAQGASQADAGAATALFALAYTLPARHVLAPAATAAEAAPDLLAEPLWQSIWRTQPWRIAILALALLALYAVLALQDQVAARPRLWRNLRTGALAFALLWLGWYAGAQLSVVHVLTFVEALRTTFLWDVFLADPLTFILWSWVAVAMAFWGRGVFCGWLCPFGALQELLGRAARALRLPQLRLPFVLHERLVPAKYILFFALFAISLGDMALAFRAAEAEPFKTAIILRFMRWGPLLAYALVLLVGALFIERMFCRYLCPLGAAIALPARMRMFNWLKRRRQCGTECQICAQNCPVQAIHPNGEINPNECIHCLQCQVNYFDDTTCPPLIARRARRAQRAALQQGAPP
ncbi:MAG: 4Fe-4S binding protein [Alphaproteobacteria bacterium]|nr:4Fe-4S binding protein [Alphaproteobacteria bacterium]